MLLALRTALLDVKDVNDLAAATSVNAMSGAFCAVVRS